MGGGGGGGGGASRLGAGEGAYCLCTRICIPKGGGGGLSFRHKIFLYFPIKDGPQFLVAGFM